MELLSQEQKLHVSMRKWQPWHKSDPMHKSDLTTEEESSSINFMPNPYELNLPAGIHVDCGQ